MLLARVCPYYQDSKCLYKRTHCDVFSCEMKHWTDDEADWLWEETSGQKEVHAPYSKKEDPIGFL